MRYAAIIASVLLQPAAWANPQTPSIELLLYLAEWGQDEAWELVDPLELKSPDTHANQGSMIRQPQAGAGTAEGQR